MEFGQRTDLFSSALTTLINHGKRDIDLWHSNHIGQSYLHFPNDKFNRKRCKYGLMMDGGKNESILIFQTSKSVITYGQIIANN